MAAMQGPGRPEAQASAAPRLASYLWRGTFRRTWQATLTIALIGGLLGAVTLAAAAGARRTDSAYGRYLTYIRASDAFVNVPGQIPGMPISRPVEQIAGLPGIASAGAYVGLAADPVVRGRVVDRYRTHALTGSYALPHLSSSYFSQDRMTVLAGRLPSPSATGEIAVTPGVARLFHVQVGGVVTYQFYKVNAATFATTSAGRHAFRVTAIVDIPPVLADQADEGNSGILPPAATRRLLGSYEFAWVGVRLRRGAAGIPALQHRLTGLAARLVRQARAATHDSEPGLTLSIRNFALLQAQVQEAIRPQVIALAIFAAVAALALLVLAGQAIAQLLSRSAPEISAIQALGATSGQAALAAAMPGLVGLAAGTVLAVAGAVALSPLAPVGPVRQFDPVRGVQLDGLAVLGGGLVVLVAALLVLAAMAWRAVRRPAHPAEGRRSAVARAAAATGLPAAAVIGSRNALEPGSGRRAVPVRATLTGSAAAVTAVVAAVVFGTSLTGLLQHPVQYGWNWNVLLQAEGGYGNFSSPAQLSRLVNAQPAVVDWSEFGFGQLPIDGQVIPVLGVQRQRGIVEPPTTSGVPLTGSDQIELGKLTLHQLGKKIGDTVVVGRPPFQSRLTIVGTVTLPSFGVTLTDHVSLGRGAMLSERALLAAVGATSANLSGANSAQEVPSAVAIDLVPGTTARQRTRLISAITSRNPDGDPGGTYALPRVLASSVVNASQMGSQPLALALGLAAAALISLALTVLAAVRRRRRELGLLKTLGMTRRQVRAVVGWQTTVILTVAALAGIPLGVAAGRWAWTGFADSLGVAPAPQVPVLWLVIGFVVLLAAGNLLALVPAEVAARIRPAATLRAE